MMGPWHSVGNRESVQVLWQQQHGEERDIQRKKLGKKPKTTQSCGTAVVGADSGDAKLYNQFFFGVDTDL